MIVALDYGQFTLCGGPGCTADYMELLDEALGGPDIAACGHDHVVLVCSPHQNNFHMPLRIEVWDNRPPDDHDEWEEEFESSLTIEGGVLRYDSPTLESAYCDIPDDHYGVLVCGRGFVNRGWPGSTTPGDSWRVRLWPAPGSLPTRRIKTW